MGFFYVPLYPSPPDCLFVTFLPRKLVQVDKLVCVCLTRNLAVFKQKK